MKEATFGQRFLSAVRASSHSAGPWTFAQISRIEGASRDVLASELHITCEFLPPSFMALVALADPETLGRVFVDELRRHQEEQRKKSDWDADVD